MKNNEIKNEIDEIKNGKKKFNEEFSYVKQANVNMIFNIK